VEQKDMINIVNITTISLIILLMVVNALINRKSTPAAIIPAVAASSFGKMVKKLLK